MKRIVCLLVLAGIFLFPFSTDAASIPTKIEQLQSKIAHIKDAHDIKNKIDSSYDFSGLSLSELIELQEHLQLAMWNSKEWQEVEVPQGIYRIGTDIPAGKWTITAADGCDATIKYGDTLDSAEADIEWSDGIYYAEMMAGEGSWRDVNMHGQYVKTVSLKLQGGAYFLVNDGPVVFSTYTAPNLGFK